MVKAKIEDLKEGKTVYYIPSHLDPIVQNAEKGRVSTVNERGVWVRYTDGDTGAKTNIEDLYV